MNDLGCDPPPGYNFIKILGRGSFSTVWQALDLTTREKVAIKVMRKSKSDPKEETRFQNEAKLTSTLRNPYIVRFKRLIEDDDYRYLVMEYLSGGTLKSAVEKSCGLPEQKVKRYFREILCALKYLHKTIHVLHRDIKAENIMLDAADNIRLIDLGFAGNYEPNDPSNEFCGSPKYAAPEVYAHLPYSASADIWSCGVLLFFCLTGTYPFNDVNIRSLSKKVRTVDPIYPTTISPSAKSLISSMLSKVPSNRPPISSILSSPFIGNESSPHVLKICRDHSFNRDDQKPPPLPRAPVSAPQLLIGDTVVDKLVATGKFVPSPRSSPRPQSVGFGARSRSSSKLSPRAPSVGSPTENAKQARKKVSSSTVFESPKLYLRPQDNCL